MPDEQAARIEQFRKQSRALDESQRGRPYVVRRLDLEAYDGSPRVRVRYRGNCITVLRIVADVAADREIRIRIDTQDADPIPVRDPLVLPLPYNEAFIEWDGPIVGGAVDLLFCTIIP